MANTEIYSAPDVTVTEFEVFDILTNMYVGTEDETHKDAIIDWR